MRELLKRVAERTLLLASRLRSNRSMAGRALVLAYHNVVPRGERPFGDRSLHLPQEAFSLQLDILTERLEVVALDAILMTGDSPRVAITWDDAYAGAVHAGVAEVTRRNLPATMFVAPGMLGGRTFWWDGIATDTDLGPERRSAALEDGAGDTDRVRRLAADRGWTWREAPEHARTASEDAVRNLRSLPGIAVGAHSWSHPNLNKIDPARLESELARSRGWVADQFGSAGWFAYPYGLAEPRVVAAAGRAGFPHAVRIEGGWFAPAAVHPLEIPRLNVPAGFSRTGFELRLAGALG